MKLRNKKTGGIDDFRIEASGLEWTGYTSLKEFCEDYEDYEEPKEYWTIDMDGEVKRYALHSFNSQITENIKSIGNYFSSQEEAEKVVEKLKAWKRLKDVGFKFIDHIDRDSGQGMTRYERDGYVNGEDLDLLFGGEE